MKPPGLTACLQVVMPSHVEDRIWEAVREAIASGWTPKQFISEADDAWQHELRESAKDAHREFAKVLKP